MTCLTFLSFPFVMHEPWRFLPFRAYQQGISSLRVEQNHSSARHFFSLLSTSPFSETPFSILDNRLLKSTTAADELKCFHQRRSKIHALACHLSTPSST